MITKNLVLHHYCDYEVDQKLHISDQFLYLARSNKQNNQAYSVVTNFSSSIHKPSNYQSKVRAASGGLVNGSNGF